MVNKIREDIGYQQKTKKKDKIPASFKDRRKYKTKGAEINIYEEKFQRQQMSGWSI